MLNLIVRELRGQGTAEMRPCGIDPSGSQLSAGDGSRAESAYCFVSFCPLLVSRASECNWEVLSWELFACVAAIG